MPTKTPGRKPVQKRANHASSKTIVWLASYPKSGNTWVRIFLANYLMGQEQPVPINEVHRIGMGDALSVLYQRVNGGYFDPSDIVGHLALRDRVVRAVAANGADLNFMKTHNFNGTVQATRLINPAFTKSAVYIVRDPRDVVVSYARHYGISPSKACREISRPETAVLADRSNVTQYLGSWSKHVRDWSRSKAFPVLVMRYEDLKADAVAAFGQLLDFIGIPADPDKLERAVTFSSFDELKGQEQKDGFIERSPNAESFFHSGTSGQWDGVLDEDDLAFLESKHGAVMRQFGYL